MTTDAEREALDAATLREIAALGEAIPMKVLIEAAADEMARRRLSEPVAGDLVSFPRAALTELATKAHWYNAAVGAASQVMEGLTPTECIEAQAARITSDAATIADLSKHVYYLRDALDDTPQSVWRDIKLSTSAEEAIACVDGWVSDAFAEIKAKDATIAAKDAEIERLNTELEEQDIISLDCLRQARDAQTAAEARTTELQAEVERLRKVLAAGRFYLDRIVTEYPVNHTDKFCLQVAKQGLRSLGAALNTGESDAG